MSKSHEVRVAGYLNKHLHSLVEGEKVLEQVTESKIIKKALQDYYSKKSKEEIERIKQAAKENECE